MQYYLKSSIKAEPLIWQWYAWPYLIPPLTAGCNILKRHIKIMKSYIESPEIHRKATENPNLAGGSFMNYRQCQTDAIKHLLHKTTDECKELISLAKAYHETNDYLQTVAQGDSLYQHYKSLPDKLKGCVELVYDLNNNPSIRLIEPLIYDVYYKNDCQSISLSDTSTDQRPFVLSTPRIEFDSNIKLDVPFSDKRIDRLFASNRVPLTKANINELLDSYGHKIENTDKWFTNHNVLAQNRHVNSENDIRMRYFGHACLLLQTKNVNILIDPMISYRFATSFERFTLDDLPDRIDYVLLTHNHQDHVLFEMLLRLRHKIDKIIFPRNNPGSLADPSLRLILQKLGFNNLIELEEMQTLSIPDGEITGLPFLGEHSDLNIQTKIAHYVRLFDKKFLFAADSKNISASLYERIKQSIATSIDVLCLGMECKGAPLTWLYGPLLSKPIEHRHNYNRTLSGSDFTEAVKIIESLGCTEVYIYAMGQEPWLNFLMSLEYNENSPQMIESAKLLKYCQDRKIQAKKLYLKDEWVY